MSLVSRRRFCSTEELEPAVTRSVETLLRQALMSSASRASDVSELEGLASKLLTMAISGQKAVAARVTAVHRRRVVATAEELMRSRLHAPPSVTELCKATHTSSRALFYAFQSLLGRSPIQHCQILRLHAARRRFLQRGSDAYIRGVAEGLGFMHSGRFSADYRQLFGELPSETRKRRAGPNCQGR